MDIDLNVDILYLLCSFWTSCMNSTKRIITIIFALYMSVLASGQDKIKHGLNSVPYPVIGFSDDLGIQYGFNYTLFDYGDGSIFPNYRHKLVTEISRYTKGQTSIKMAYNSAYLIPGIKVSAAVAYNMSPMYHFYGFNGSVSPVDRSIDHKNGVAYYNLDRKFVRAVANFIGPLSGDLSWAAGLNFLSYRFSSVNERYGYDTERSLYNDYIKSGVIRENEAKGGEVLEINAGFVYDTRNATSIPSKGIWSELYLTGSPDFFDTSYSYLRLCAHFRHYVTVLDNDRVTFAYHLGYQGLLAGEAPFYVLQNITSLVINKTVYEGLGNKNTLRGTLYNRFIGNGYAWANAEFRIKIVSFILKNQGFYIATNPFIDCGSIAQPFRLDAPKGSEAYRLATKLHGSAGIGLKLVINKNHVTSIEIAKPFNKDDGHFGLIMGSNYLF